MDQAREVVRQGLRYQRDKRSTGLDNALFRCVDILLWLVRDHDNAGITSMIVALHALVTMVVTMCGIVSMHRRVAVYKTPQ